MPTNLNVSKTIDSLFLDKLHDSIFVEFTFNWENSILTILVDEIGYDDGLTKITLTQVDEVSITQKNEWSPSVYIDEIEVKEVSDRHSLIIGLQSGDKLVVSFKAFEVIRNFK